jgi:hypothetical protein
MLLNLGDCAPWPIGTVTGDASPLSRTCVESNLKMKFTLGPLLPVESSDFLQDAKISATNDKDKMNDSFILIVFNVYKCKAIFYRNELMEFKLLYSKNMPVW